MFDFGDRPEQDHTAPRSLACAVAHLRMRRAYRGRVLGLRKINRELVAINRHLGAAQEDQPAHTAIGWLQQVGARVAQEIASPLDYATAGARIIEQYLAGLGRLIRAYAATELMLDDETLAKLGWVTVQIRLEYLRARLVVNGNPVVASNCATCARKGEPSPQCRHPRRAMALPQIAGWGVNRDAERL